MKVRQAYRLVARAMQKHRDFIEEHFGEKGRYYEEYLAEQYSEIPKVLLDEELELRDNIETLLFQFATYPQIFDKMIVWKIKIGGESSTQTQEEMPSRSDLDSNEKIEEFIEKSGGNLMASVKALLNELEIFTLDKRAGIGYWSVMVECTNSRAETLCRAMHKHFKKAIASGLISLARGYVGYKLEDLESEEDIERWL